MKFEVNKFLALTALLAGASAVAAGCSSTDSKQAPGESGGEAGESPTPGAGTGNTTSEAGAAGTSEAQGGAAGATAAEAGASDGGASDGGAAGAPVVGACISDLVGAAGAADESSPCDLLGAAGASDCGDEGGNYVAQGCYELYSTGYYRPSVILAFNECGKALADSCDQNGVIDCATGLIGRGCTEETTNAACTFVASKCPGVTPSLCAGIMDLVTPEAQSALKGCMDPANELYYDPYTTSPNLDCDLNLQYCANLPVPALR